MRSASFSSLALLLSFLLAAGVSAAEPGPDKRPAVDVPALIDKLVEVAESDIGYSGSVTGNSFSPLDRAGEVQVGRLFQKPSVPSETLREIVKQGAAAVPHLIAHLGDQRTTKITMTHDGGLGGMFYGDELDYNERTTRPPLVPPRRDDEEDGLARLFGRSAKQPHKVTVGDLCFVALGQIVNRHFNAVRYQPTAIIILSSPTSSPALRQAVTKEWGALTSERHRALLTADFLKPDSEGRRIGACKRLAYYYPDALEPLARQMLAQPAYDASDVHAFVRQTLYRAKDAQKRRALFDAYLARKGQPSRDGILLQLFEDLQTLEAHEEKSLSRPLTDYGTQPRELLIELYGYGKKVRSTQRPPFTDSLERDAKARLIEEGLIYDHSARIDRAVRDLLASIKDDDHLALACMKRLVGRGYDADIEKYCRRRIPVSDENSAGELRTMRDRLGWNLVHVAVDRHDRDGLRDLIAGGANLQASARNGMTPLHLAAASGDIDLAKLLLDARVNLDPKNARGETPVQLAAHEDHDEMAQFLVQRGCAVPDILTAAVTGRRERVASLLANDPALAGAATRHKRTPLHLAARWGHAPVAELLLDKGAKVNAEDEGGRMALHVALAWRHEPVVRILLAHKADVRAKLPYGGPQPLHLAVQTRDVKLVRLLLDHKADVNARAGGMDGSPLHYAVVKGSPAIAELLLKAGAAVEARDKEGRTPLHVAAEVGQADVARVLLKHKANVTARVKGEEGYAGYQPLHIAAAEGHVPVMEVLLANKADLRVGTRTRVEAQGYREPLHLAAERGHIEAARCLLKHGADINRRPDSVFTPLYFAARSGEVDMVRFLLDHKAEIQASPPDGWGPLPIAASFGHREVVRVLLDHKPDISKRDKDEALYFATSGEDPALVELLLNRGASVHSTQANGETPLHAVAAGGSVRVARVLLDHKANVRAASRDTGAEPLHEAAAHGSTKMIALLLDRGAEVNARQKSDGRTPLHCAVEADERRQDRAAAIALLLKRKADCTIKDKDGLTPLTLAVKKKRTALIHLLRQHGVKE